MARLTTEDLVDELLNLAGDEPAASDYQSPRHLVVSLWHTDQNRCREMILASIKHWDEVPQLFDDIVMASRNLNDRDFLTLLHRCSVMESTPANCRLALSSLLVDSEERRLEEFESQFRKQVRKIIDGKLNPDRVDFGTRIRELCRFQLKKLAPELEQLKTPRFHLSGHESTRLADANSYELIPNHTRLRAA